MYRLQDHDHDTWQRLLARLAAGEVVELDREVAHYFGLNRARPRFLDLDGQAVRGWRDEAGRFWFGPVNRARATR